MSTVIATIMVAGIILAGARIIFGIGPTFDEAVWAIEDSIAWIAERVPLQVLFFGVYALLFGSIAMLIARLFA